MVWNECCSGAKESNFAHNSFVFCVSLWIMTNWLFSEVINDADFSEFTFEKKFLHLTSVIWLIFFKTPTQQKYHINCRCLCVSIFTSSILFSFASNKSCACVWKWIFMCSVSENLTYWSAWASRNYLKGNVIYAV